MDRQLSRIRPLPLEVQGQISSSIAITSLEDVVLELLKNALDAGANIIDVQVDLIRGYCAVSDNGVGIPAPNFEEEGHLGKMHCTSKHDQSSQTYGQHGRFLSCLSALSLLTIHSRHEQSPFESQITFHRTRVISRTVTQLSEEGALDTTGTKVIVRDLFGSMPVRLKRRAAQFEASVEYVKEFERLKKGVVALLLAWAAPVNITIREVRSKQMYLNRATQRGSAGNGTSASSRFTRDHICGVLARAGLISSADRDNWKIASAQTGLVSIRAAISLTPFPTKNRQFISLGHMPLDPDKNGLLFDKVNQLFETSTFGNVEDDVDHLDAEQLEEWRTRAARVDGHIFRQSRPAGKGVDRWPIFYIRIVTKGGTALASVHRTSLEEDGPNTLLKSVLALLHSFIEEFVIAHGFQTKSRKHRRRRRIALGRMESVPNVEARSEPPSSWQSEQSRPNSTTSQQTAPAAVISRNGVHYRQFTNWPRVKAVQSSIVADILSGLPQSKQLPEPPCEPALEKGTAGGAMIKIGRSTLEELRCGAVIDSEVQLLLDNLSDHFSDNISESIKQTERSPTPTLQRSGASPGKTYDAQEVMLWTNPRTGTQVRLDPRTGLTLAARPSKSAAAQKSSFFGPQPSASKLASKEVLQSRIKRLVQTSSTFIFHNSEEPIISISCGMDDSDGRVAVTGRQTEQLCAAPADFFAGQKDLAEFQVTKSSLGSAEVLGQVDRKFILVRLDTGQEARELHSKGNKPGALLVLIDQHAADERIKVEQLYRDLSTTTAVCLDKPIVFEVPEEEATMFTRRRGYFSQCDFVYEVKNSFLSRPASSRNWKGEISRSECSQHVAVMALPAPIAERCRLEPKIVIELLRRAVWDEKSKRSWATGPASESSEEWASRLSGCPTGLLEMMNSRACRSAVMFNDELTQDQCEGLVKKLSMCVLPFQCAHGRPSMVVLMGLTSVVSGSQEERKGGGFGGKWREWQGVGRQK